MDFHLTEEQKKRQQHAANVVAKYITPYAAQWDQESTFPEEALRQCAAHGLTGLSVSQEFGGKGASTLSYALNLMEIAAACNSVATSIAVTSMVAETIARFGTPAQREHYIPKLLSGEFLTGSFGLSEPGAGSDAAALTTRGKLSDEHVVINGEKCWITSGTHSKVFLVWVRTEEAKGAKGISVFLVEPDDPGFEVGRKEDKMGLRASSTVSLQFQECKIPLHRRLGEPGKGFPIAMKTLDVGRIGVASQALGVARRALQCLHEYVQTKQKTFHSGQHAHVAHMLTCWHKARLLIFHAAWRKDQKRAFSYEAAMAKAYSTEIANQICQKVIALIGEEACSNAYPVERLLRDCKVTTIYEGTSEVQRIVISRSLLRE